MDFLRTFFGFREFPSTKNSQINFYHGPFFSLRKNEENDVWLSLDNAYGSYFMVQRSLSSFFDLVAGFTFERKILGLKECSGCNDTVSRYYGTQVFFEETFSPCTWLILFFIFPRPLLSLVGFV